MCAYKYDKQTALARVDRVPAVITHYESYKKFGMAAVYAGLVGGGSEKEQLGRALVAIQFGAELGIGPTAALRGIYVQNGRPCCNAGLVSSVIKASGEYDYKILQRDAEGCRLQFQRNGSAIDDGTKGMVSFTMADAKKAGLTEGKNAHSYKKYSRQMLFARAITEGARVYCPHLFAGSVYTREELGGDYVPEAEFEVADESLDAASAPVSDFRGEEHKQSPATPAAAAGQDGPAEPAKKEDTQGSIVRATEEQVQQLDRLCQYAKAMPDKMKIVDFIRQQLELDDQGWLSTDRADQIIERASGALPGWSPEWMPGDPVGDDDPGPPPPDGCDHEFDDGGICRKCGTVDVQDLPFG